jgi:hypothetical protein
MLVFLLYTVLAVLMVLLITYMYYYFDGNEPENQNKDCNKQSSKK